MKRVLFLILLLMVLAVPAYAAAPTATSFSSTASTVGATLLQLQGADADGTALTYAIASGPSHGTLSGLITATGYVVYTPTAAYTGADSFTYTVTSGGDTTAAATVTLTVTNAKTRIVDHVVDAGGNGRPGIVTFILTQKVFSPAGLIPVSATVSGVVASDGSFDVSLYPSTALSPQAYYQMWFTATGSLRRELIGVYAIPATSATSILLEPYRVTDTNLAAQYTFMSTAAINSLATGLGSGISGAGTAGTIPYLSAGTTLADSPLLRLGSGTVGFATGTAAAPSTGSSLTGTRLLMYPGSSGEHLGMGVESGKLWFNVGSANAFKYYWAASTAENHTVTPSQYLINTASTTFTLNYQTSGTPSASAMKLMTNAYTVRVGPDPLVDNSATWDFTTSAIQPFADDTMSLGAGSHWLAYIFAKNYVYRGSTSGMTTVRAAAVAGTTTVTLPAATDTLVARDTTDTLTNKTLTSPKVGTSINDTNGNEVIKTPATASAVNEITVTNAATGSDPSISGTGGDTDVGLNFVIKGSPTDGFQFRRGSTLVAQIGRGGISRFELVPFGAFASDPSNAPFILNSSTPAQNTVSLANAAGISWSSNALYYGTLDVGIVRSAAGRMEVNDGNTAGVWRDLKVRQHYIDATMTGGGTTGAQTINKAAGSVNFAASASSLVVTDSLVTTSSIIIATVMTNDGTLKSVQCVPGSGSFTMYANAAATAETKVAFIVINQ